MTKKQNKTICGENLVTAILKMLHKNVPVLTFWEHKGELIHLGSSSMSKWFDDFEDVIKQDLRSRMVSDIVNLSNNTEELLVDHENVPDKVRASCLYKSLTNHVHPSGTQPLPFPLSLMSKKEKSKYLCDLIRAEAKERKTKLVYGSEICRPSFWLEDEWSWTNVKKSLFLVEEKTFTGQGSWTEFLSKTIKVVFDSNNLSPETHVQNLELKMKTLKKKKRFRGIHESPVIVSMNRTEDTNSTVNEAAAHKMQDDSFAMQEESQSTPEYFQTMQDSQTMHEESLAMQEDTQNIQKESQAMPEFSQTNFDSENNLVDQNEITVTMYASQDEETILQSDLQSDLQLQDVIQTMDRDPKVSNIEVRKAFQPRRKVGESPFKIPTHTTNNKSNLVKIPMQKLTKKKPPKMT